MEKIFRGSYQSPIGLIEVSGTEKAITSVGFSEHKRAGEPCPLIETCIMQLDEYFKGKRMEFNVPLSPEGTPFQNKVWRALMDIPFGHTVNYQEIASAIHQERACRAVGSANGRNPVFLLIPCHRVIGKDGSLTGYSGGLWRKEWLLKHESGNLSEDQVRIMPAPEQQRIRCLRSRPA